MPETNPYECTQSFAAPTSGSRMPLLRQAIAAAPGFAVVVVAATKYPFAARSFDGAVAGAMLLVVGYVVGRLMASETTARPMAIFMSSSFAIGLAVGWVDHPGGESILWAFSCMCAGLLSGACAPVRPEDQGTDPMDVELPIVTDETTRRN